MRKRAVEIQQIKMAKNISYAEAVKSVKGQKTRQTGQIKNEIPQEGKHQPEENMSVTTEKHFLQDFFQTDMRKYKQKIGNRWEVRKTQRQKYTIIQWNARSLIANGWTVQKKNPEIICIQETWLVSN